MAAATLVVGMAKQLFALPAGILGHKARGQIRRTGEKGNGMAVTGLVIGWAAIGLFALLITLAVLVAAGTHGSSTAVPSGFRGQHAQIMPFIVKHPGHPG